MPAAGKRPEVVAVYCPLWHTYDHAGSWKGEGWCEWELLRTAVPRFPGHHQPLEPEWGCFDESDPAWAAREIDLAADHGIDVFMIDWYWYSGVRIMEEALENGFLKAPNRNRLKFCLMWANHHWADYFPAPFGREWNSWLPCRHSLKDTLRVMDYCIEHYFRQPNYWTVEGRLFFSMFNPIHAIQELGGPKGFRDVFDRMNRHLEKSGLPRFHLNAMSWGAEHVPTFREAGFDSTTFYNIISSGKVSENLTERYEDLIVKHQERWAAMSATALPYFPVITMGWDVTPRCEKSVSWPFPPSPLSGNRDYPYISVIEDNTPELFKELCRMARRHVEQTGPTPNAVLINAWNEWTEGCYLLPEKRHGLGFLKAVKEALG
ncbi:MAG TPA: glycoside hydrolase family 99-like domain-containing protein [Candidatus Brocadiia bacterium]|nr:glycoside hydrolase family 99-like domain-containing protein [Candidatus Brocadiia bacterium]